MSAHPAKFGDPILQRIAEMLASNVDFRPLVIDPFAGTGKVHQLSAVRCVGVEIEPEWAAMHPDTIVANALHLPFRDATFDGMITSPVYGNRLCLTGDTMVLTAEHGHIPISQVRAGDHALTHTGAWQLVLWSGRTGLKPVVELRGQVASRLRCTADHRILVRERSSAKTANLRLGAERWLAAGDTERTYWLTPARSTKPFARGAAPMADRPESWWAVGFWLANGATYMAPDGSRATVLFSKDTTLADPIEERLRRAFGDALRPNGERTGCRVWCVYRKALVQWLRSTFGCLSHSKTVPGWVLGLPEDSRRALLDGWLDGDGCPTGRNGERIGGSVSLGLIRGMQSLAHSVGWSTGIHQAKVAGIEMVNGRLCPVRDAWQLKVTSRKTRRTHHEDGLDATQIVSVAEAGYAHVYDLVVDEDHSFVANGVIVHNSDAHEACDGSVRHSYTHTLGRRLHPANSGQLQWGDAYRHFHDAAWSECLRVLRPGAFVIVNISNHIRKFEEQFVTEWHLQWFLAHGCSVVDMTRVRTKRHREGANYQARVDGENIFRLQYGRP